MPQPTKCVESIDLTVDSDDDEPSSVPAHRQKRCKLCADAAEKRIASKDAPTAESVDSFTRERDSHTVTKNEQ